MVTALLVQFFFAILFGLAGWTQWSSAERFCQQMRERRAKANKTVRLLFYPRWFYTGHRCVWQIRVGAVAAMLIALFLASAAIFTLVRR